MFRKSLLLAGVLAVAATIAGGIAGADSANIDFETYSVGSVDGQDGWSKTGPYDVEIVANNSGFVEFGTKALRISNAVTSGSFGDHAFSPSVVDEAGEVDGVNDGLSGGTRQAYFEAQWSFASTIPGAEQPGLSVVVSPDRGDGARMSWLEMRDTATGLEVNFYDYVSGGFRYTNLASGLDRTTPHTIKLAMSFLDGPANDIVDVWIDGIHAHTGTTWEDYFRDWQPPGSRTVDSLLFRVGGTAAPATSGNGFLIDNIQLFSGPGPMCTFTTVATTMTLDADCFTDQTILIPNGFTLDGDSHTITAVDPAGGHFLGAVVANDGAVAHVTKLTVTASGLANVCDGGDDRLRGIMFDGAGGSISKSAVIGINQGASGCQEGNAIEVRNAPFDFTHPDTLQVEIAQNVVDSYQKTGIVANGDVDVDIHHNVVGASATQENLAANSIQLGFGALGSVTHNQVDGNQWKGTSNWAATAILIYDASPGVEVSQNNIGGNSDIGVYVFADGTVANNNRVFDDGVDHPNSSYDIGIGAWGSDNAVTNNKVRGFETPYDGLGDDLGSNKSIPTPAN